MKMYHGEYHIILDDRGRLPLSAPIRTEVERQGHHTWWITQGFDGQLLLFHEEHWKRILKEQIPPASMNPRIMDFRRRFVGTAHRVEADRQSRLLIPAPLRTYAQMSRETVLLGIEDRMELWGMEKWKEFRDGKVDDYKVLAMEFFGQHRYEAGQTQEDTEHAGM